MMWLQRCGLAWQAAAEAARVAAERRGAEAAQRQAHRQELRKQEEAQALTNLRAFKDSIKAVVSRVSLSHCCSNLSPVDFLDSLVALICSSKFPVVHVHDCTLSLVRISCGMLSFHSEPLRDS